MQVSSLALSSALVKIFEICHVIFQITSQFLFQILNQSSVSWKITPLYFFIPNVVYFAHKEPIKTNFLDFWVHGSKFAKFIMSVLKWQANFSSIFVSFFFVMTHSSYVNFELIHFLLWTKGSHQCPNFDTFECAGETCQIPYIIFQTTSQEDSLVLF